MSSLRPTSFSPRPWDVRWGRWVTCRGCLGRHRRAGLVCPLRAAVTSVETTTPAMLPSGRPGVAGVVVWWAILCYPKEGSIGRRWVLRRPPRREAVTFRHGATLLSTSVGSDPIGVMPRLPRS